jgi:hypothetical protein
LDSFTADTEFLRPLTHAWMAKLELSKKSRDPWKQIADECMMFYSQSARAMWDPSYSKKFWRGVSLPKFRVTINKAFEMVAIMGPNLFWEVPHRTVESKRSIQIPMELFGQDEQGQMMAQQLQMMQMQFESQDKTIAYLMDRWLNYTPREQPGGGLETHSMRAIVDALIKGRGVLAPRPYKMPGSGRTLTGAFRVAPEDVYLDPDFDSVDDCKWMCIKHIDVHSDVESRFELPPGSLKNRSTLESSWNFGEHMTDDSSNAQRKDGRTNDLIVWYEIFSKSGVGVSSTTVDSQIRDHLDKVVGEYAYIVISPDVPYPLNMSSEKFRQGASDEEVKAAFSWPVPYWSDDRWPVEFLDFYEDPESAWPVAPLAPGLGELKLLNFLMSWFANRTWSSSRDFWAVAAPYLEHYKEYILNGEDQSIIPTPIGLKSPKEGVEILTQPESRQDMTQLIEYVSQSFDRRVGLTPTIYGQNENNTQSRTAEETQSKQRAVMARPEFMQKQVVGWQSRVSSAEAFITRLFVTADDVMPLLGPAGAYLWSQAIESSDIELVARQFNYTVAASSIRRPNRDRDIGNFQQVMSQFTPVLATFGQATGDYGPFNGMMEEWGALHDANMDSMLLPVKEPPTPEEEAQQAQLQMQQIQLEMAELDGKVKKLNAEAQSISVEPQLKQAELQMKQQEIQSDMQIRMAETQAEMQLSMAESQADMQIEQAKAGIQMQSEQIKQQGLAMKQQLDMAKMQGALELTGMQAAQEQQQKTQAFQIDLMQDMQKHEQELLQDEESHVQEMMQKEAMAKADVEAKKRQAAIKPNKAASSGKTPKK